MFVIIWLTTFLTGPTLAANVNNSSDVPPDIPQRIVSINLCTDQMLIQLVDPERIVSVSWLVADPVSSNMAEQAKTLTLNHGQAEEILLQQPDLILAGTYGAGPTVALLERLGFEVVKIPPATSIEAMIENYRTLGLRLGEEKKAKAIITNIENILVDATPPPNQPLPLYTNYDPNGFIAGPGSLLYTLAHIAGLDLLSDRLGRGSSGRLSLEALLLASPDIISQGDRYGKPTLATTLLDHPAMRPLLAQSERVTIPSRETLCGTSHALTALTRLVKARNKWQQAMEAVQP